VLLPKKLLVLENETPLRKQEKLPPERESVQLHQEKVLEEQPEEKVLEEKPQGDLLEGEDDRIFFSFLFHLIRTVKSVRNSRLFVSIFCDEELLLVSNHSMDKKIHPILCIHRNYCIVFDLLHIYFFHLMA